MKPSTVVCYLCWIRQERPLSSCFLSLMNNNYSNAWTHIKGKHEPKEYPALSDESTVTDTVKSSSTKMKQNQMTDFKSQGFPQGSSRHALTLLYHFFNDANLAIDQSSNTNLRKFVSYIIENASSFAKRKSDVYFTKYKFKKYEVEVFVDFLTVVKTLIESTREFYTTALGFSSSPPFLYVSHDGWDSKDHDVLGVSIHFILPRAWIPVSLSVGLQRVTSKESAYTAAKILQILER